MRHKFCALFLPLPSLIFSNLHALIYGFLWWWACSWLIFSLKWHLQSPFLLLHSAAISLQEAKDSIGEEYPRTTSSTWSYINGGEIILQSVLLRVCLITSVATYPFVGKRGEAHGCVFRSWRIFQIRELYLRLRKVLAPLTFVPKDNSLNFRIVCNCVPKLLFLFLRSTKAGLLLLRTLYRRGNQTYVLLSKGEIKRFFILGKRSF